MQPVKKFRAGQVSCALWVSDCEQNELTASGGWDIARLVDKDVQFVEVTLSRWDTLSDNFEGTPREPAILDHARNALLADLKAKGLLDQTLVVLGTEFG